MEEPNNMAFLTEVAANLMKHGKPEQAGLSDGAMGYALFFYWLSRKTGVKQYEEYADVLVDSAYEGINVKSSNLNRGVLGVVCGIEFLIQNDFCDGDSDELLEDADEWIRKWLFNRKCTFQDLSEVGFYLYARYTTVRSCSHDAVERRLRRAVLQYLESLNLLLKSPMDDATGLAVFDVNHPLFLNLGVLVEFERFDIFNYRSHRLVGSLLGLFQECMKDMNRDNKIYLVYLLKRFQQCVNVNTEIRDVADRLIDDLDVSTAGHPLFGSEPLACITPYRGELFFGMSGMRLRVISVEEVTRTTIFLD